MPKEIGLLPAPLQQVAERIFTQRRISCTDQKLLMSVLLSQDAIAPSEQYLVNWMFDGLKQGWLRVVN